MKNTCSCCSEKTYENCCKQFHVENNCKNPIDLVKSRFSAYALNIADYIIKTTHPLSPQYIINKTHWKKDISYFSNSFSFEKLEILDFQEKENMAIVVFTIYLKQKDKNLIFTEKSYFEKLLGKWFYKIGTMVKGRDTSEIEKNIDKILPITYFKNPIFEKKILPITKITDDIRKLVEKMIITMDIYNGIGLAATQVNYNLPLFIIRPVTIQEDTLEMGDIKVFINPKIIFQSTNSWEENEGCLSLPSINALVKRPCEIKMKFTTLDGEEKEEQFFNWEAKEILHENDHFNSIFFTDHLSKKEKYKIQSSFENLMQRIDKYEK